MIPIAIINQKGGVGKTTTTANLGVALNNIGKNVLIIDLDPQAHLSMHLGIDTTKTEKNSYTFLTKQPPLSSVIHNINDSLHVLPACMDLSAAETELISVIGRETILRDAMYDCADYDYVLMDCPPSLGLLTLNGLCSAREVIIPMQAHFLALQGVSKLLETIKLVYNRINSDLTVRGVLLCMHDNSTKLGNEVEQDLRSFFESGRNTDTPWSKAIVFNTVIRRNIKLAECPSYGLSVFDYAPKSNGAIDYRNFADEIVSIHESELKAGPSLTVRIPGDTIQNDTDSPDSKETSESTDQNDNINKQNDSDNLTDTQQKPHKLASTG